MGDNENIISDDKIVSEELNNFFQNATKTLNIIENSYLTNNANEVLDPIDKAVFKYKNHPSILTIKNSLRTTLFLFNEVFFADIEEELSNLNAKKSSTFKNIPAKILKISRNSCSETLKALFNKTVLTGTFPNELKLGNVTPVFKKKNPLKSKNYRPVSVLPVVSKIFERIMHKQMSLYVDNFLLPYLCGYRKGFNTQ